MIVAACLFSESAKDAPMDKVLLVERETKNGRSRGRSKSDEVLMMQAICPNENVAIGIWCARIENFAKNHPCLVCMDD